MHAGGRQPNVFRSGSISVAESSTRFRWTAGIIKSVAQRDTQQSAAGGTDKKHLALESRASERRLAKDGQPCRSGAEA